jgi:hypothetical protein
MAVLLQNQFSDFVRTVPGYEIKQASALITGKGFGAISDTRTTLVPPLVVDYPKGVFR